MSCDPRFRGPADKLERLGPHKQYAGECGDEGGQETEGHQQQAKDEEERGEAVEGKYYTAQRLRRHDGPTHPAGEDRQDRAEHREAGRYARRLRRDDCGGGGEGQDQGRCDRHSCEKIPPRRGDGAARGLAMGNGWARAVSVINSRAK